MRALLNSHPENPSITHYELVAAENDRLKVQWYDAQERAQGSVVTLHCDARVEDNAGAVAVEIDTEAERVYYRYTDVAGDEKERYSGFSTVDRWVDAYFESK